MKISTLFWWICLWCCFSSCAKPTTYILVRHAEKQDTTRDTPISAIGSQRAKQLATLLNSCWSSVDQVYASQYLRTLQTVQPTAVAHGLTPIRYRTDSLDLLIRELKNIRSKTVLIASHSNKVNLIFNALNDGTDMPEIPDAYYDGIYIVMKKGSSTKQWILEQSNFSCPAF